MKKPAPQAQASGQRTRPARRPPPKLARSVGPHLTRLAEASGAMDPRLADDWAEIAGADIAALCRPVRIVRRGKTQALEVSVKSGAAAMKVQYAQEALLSRLRQTLGLPHLTKISFREGKQPRSWEQRRVKPGVQPAPTPKRSAPADDGRKKTGLHAALEEMRRTIHEKDR